MFCFARSSREVCIDSINGFLICACDKVADHETYRMVLSILPRTKSVNSFLHVFAAQIRIGACNALALDNRMRVVLLCSQEDCNQHQRDVRSTIRNYDCGIGS